MSLRFIDSFDHYDTDAILNKWTRAVLGSGDFAVTTTNARTGPQCMQVRANGIWKTIDRQPTWIIGCAFYPTAAAPLLQLRDEDGNIHNTLSLNSDGTWNINLGQSVVIGTSDPAKALHFNRYYFVEWKQTIGGSGTMRLNGQVIATTTTNTSVDTRTYADSIIIQGPGGGVFHYIDDLYVCDGQDLTSGANPNNDFLGDCRVGVIVPNGTGDLTAWSPVGTATVGTNTFSGTNWRLVNEQPPDNDLTYVTQSATGTTDLYNFQDISASVSVKGIQSNITARKDDQGDRGIALDSKPSSGGAAPTTEFTSTNTYFLNQTYIDYLDQFDLNPVTSTAWTPVEINASQWGPKIVG